MSNSFLRDVNKITLVRRRSIYLPASLFNEEVISENIPIVSTFIVNLSDLGFILTEKTIKKLLTYKEQIFSNMMLGNLLHDLIDKFRELKGAEKEYNPMYPGFPESVMSMSEAELTINAFLHYVTDGYYMPSEEERAEIQYIPEEKDYDNFEKINLIMNTGDLDEIFFNLMSANGSLSEQDKNDVTFYFKHIYDVRTMLPEIPYKENMAFVANLYIENVTQYQSEKLQNWCKTATDVLRFYAAISDADVSLSKPPRFRNLTNRERKLLMNLLANVKSDLEADMYRYPEFWKRAGERIHPGHYKALKYKKVREAFNNIRSGKKFRTFGSNVESLLLEKNYDQAVELLGKRPGEFIRRLDLLLRKAEEAGNRALTFQIINKLGTVAESVATPVLLQVIQHFMVRDVLPTRTFYPKTDSGQKVMTIENNLSPIDIGISSHIVHKLNALLIARFEKLPFLGNVYVDPAVLKFVVPFSQRTASTATKIVTRGSRIPLKPGIKRFRPFVWWTNKKNGDRVDIDLSVDMFNEDFSKRSSVSYMSLRTTNGAVVHSGDIVNGGDYDGTGAAEFIDCDIEKVKNLGYRYIVFQIHLYTGGSFADDFKLSAGYMEINDMIDWSRFSSGRDGLERQVRKIFRESDVALSMDITSEGTQCIPLIIDLATMTIIWTDLTASSRVDFSGLDINNVNTTLNTTTQYLRSMIYNTKMTLDTLLSMHIEARGIPVTAKEYAETVFALEDDGGDYKTITPYDIDVILSEFMQ